ncbi:MAG: hypothetical protein AB4060_14670 [Crocosphaera sp.]
MVILLFFFFINEEALDHYRAYSLLLPFAFLFLPLPEGRGNLDA